MTHIIVAILIFSSFGQENALHYLVAVGIAYFFLTMIFEEWGLYFMEFMGLLILVSYFFTGGFRHDI